LSHCRYGDAASQWKSPQLHIFYTNLHLKDRLNIEFTACEGVSDAYR